MIDTIQVEKGGILLTAITVRMGSDLLVSISGGDKAHIGCVCLAVPRPSLADHTITSATVSTLNLTGHKDDAVASRVAERLASTLGIQIAVTCGIHVDGITSAGIKAVMEASDEISEKIIQNYEYQTLRKEMKS